MAYKPENKSNSEIIADVGVNGVLGGVQTETGAYVAVCSVGLYTKAVENGYEKIKTVAKGSFEIGKRIGKHLADQ